MLLELYEVPAVYSVSTHTQTIPQGLQACLHVCRQDSMLFEPCKHHVIYNMD